MNDTLIWVTCRNYESYLEQALESTLLQDYRKACVVVAHDACGVERPKGTGATRNRCMGTTGMSLVAHNYQWVVFLDADDLMPKGYIHALTSMAYSQTRDCVVTCDGEIFGEGQGRIRVKTPITLESLLEYNTIHCSALIPARVFQSVGGFDESLSAYEDWDLWCRLAANGVKFVHCPDTALRIRRHSDSRHSRKTMSFSEMRNRLRQKYQSLVQTDAQTESRVCR